MADIFEKFDPNDDRHQAQVRQLAEDLAAQGPTKRILHEQEKEHFEFKPGALGRLYGSRVRQQAFLNNIHHMIHPRTKQVCHLGGLAKVGMNCPGCGKDGHYLALITRAQNDRGGEWWVVEAMPCCRKFFWVYMPSQKIKEALEQAHVDTEFRSLMNDFRRTHIDPKRS